MYLHHQLMQCHIMKVWGLGSWEEVKYDEKLDHYFGSMRHGGHELNCIAFEIKSKRRHNMSLLHLTFLCPFSFLCLVQILQPRWNWRRSTCFYLELAIGHQRELSRSRMCNPIYSNGCITRHDMIACDAGVDSRATGGSSSTRVKRLTKIATKHTHEEACDQNGMFYAVHRSAVPDWPLQAFAWGFVWGTPHCLAIKMRIEPEEYCYQTGKAVPFWRKLGKMTPQHTGREIKGTKAWSDLQASGKK